MAPKSKIIPAPAPKIVGKVVPAGGREGTLVGVTVGDPVREGVVVRSIGIGVAVGDTAGLIVGEGVGVCFVVGDGVNDAEGVETKDGTSAA